MRANANANAYTCSPARHISRSRQKDSTRAWKCTKNNQCIHYYVRQTDDSHSQLWPQEYCIWLSSPCALQHTNDAIHCTLCTRNLQQTQHPAKSVNISFFFLCLRVQNIPKSFDHFRSSWSLAAASVFSFILFTFYVFTAFTLAFRMIITDILFTIMQFKQCMNMSQCV